MIIVNGLLDEPHRRVTVEYLEDSKKYKKGDTLNVIFEKAEIVIFLLLVVFEVELLF